MRDAVYQLQMPGDRARLHGLAFAAIEKLFGGTPPELPPLDAPDGSRVEPHPSDPRAAELAVHAREAARLDGPAWWAKERRCLRRAAEHA